MKFFVFDIDDTLYDLKDPFVMAFEKMFGYLPHDIDDLFLDFRKYNNQIYDKALNGQITMTQMCNYRAQKSFYDHGIILDESNAQKFQRTYESVKNNITVNKHILDLMDRLKSNNIPMGIITNGPTYDQNMKIDYLGLRSYFDPDLILVSEEVGFHKPDKAIFDEMKNRICHKYNCPSPEIYYMGDSYDNDIVGAKKAAYNTIWLNHRRVAPLDLSVVDYHLTSYSSISILMDIF